jgi:hypothetical protein
MVLWESDNVVYVHAQTNDHGGRQIRKRTIEVQDMLNSNFGGIRRVAEQLWSSDPVNNDGSRIKLFRHHAVKPGLFVLSISLPGYELRATE